MTSGSVEKSDMTVGQLRQSEGEVVILQSCAAREIRYMSMRRGWRLGRQRQPVSNRYRRQNRRDGRSRSSPRSLSSRPSVLVPTPHDALARGEAYSANGRREAELGAILRMPVRTIPATSSFYYSVLHFTSRDFRMSEISLRSLSVIFSLITLALVFALGREMFDDGTALAAATMWASIRTP